MPAPIRPQFPPVHLPQAPRSSEAARTAQRAFFDAALGKAAASATAPSAKPVASAEQVRTAPATQPPSEPERLLRPGSLLNIRV